MAEYSQVMIDSLPYVEDVHQDYEDYALTLIEDEMKQIEPRSLKMIPAVNFRTPLMKTEYRERVVAGEFQAREQQSYQQRNISRPSTLDEWRTVALPQAKSRFEAERIRASLLEAETDEAVLNWKAYNTIVLEQMRDQLSKTLAGQKEAVEEINFQRQQAQQKQYWPELQQLSIDYQQILYRRNQMEHAIEGVRREAKLVGKRKGAPAN